MRFAPLVYLMVLSNSFYAQDKKAAKQQAKRQSDLYLRAPGVVPGTLPEMRNATYWIAEMESPYEVVLTYDEIEVRNAAYEQRMANRPDILDSVLNNRINKQLKNRPGLLAYIPSISSMTPSELEFFTRDMIEKTAAYIRSREFGNIMAIEYSEDELTAIENEISYDSSKRKIIPQPAIITKQSRLHIIPPVKPEFIGIFTNGKARWDLWNLDVLPPGSAVSVLQTSQTGAFSFVLSERGGGWVSSEDIGICAASDCDFLNEGSDFVVCTGDRVPFYSDEKCTMVAGWLLMGDQLPLNDPNNSRLVSIPFRNANGEFSIQEAWLKQDADVQVGFLPYTQKNVAEQAFKLLDNLYDWTGSWYGRNHVTNIRDVFRCFGFQLPANGILLAAFADNAQTINPKLDREDQFGAILSNKPFMTVQISENSHSQLYIGDYKGMPIGFDAHGYSYKDDNGNDLELKRWVVGTIEMPDYFLEQEIYFVRLY